MFSIFDIKAEKEYNESNTLVPLYDNEDAVCGIVYNDVPYYFLKNQQNDIIAITDANATVVARYTYDAWGVPTVAQDITTVGIATVNPFRYRGYYYDTEIGMYYLQSRYYDPVVGRFVNGDEAIIMLVSDAVSIYSYCLNCPVNDVGEKSKKHGCGIISCWNNYKIGVLHTFVIQYSDKRFFSTNGYDKDEKTASSLSELVDNRPMIVGYWFK